MGFRLSEAFPSSYRNYFWGAFNSKTSLILYIKLLGRCLYGKTSMDDLKFANTIGGSYSGLDLSNHGKKNPAKKLRPLLKIC